MNLRLQKLLKLHKLYAPADEHGSDAGGGGDVGALEDEGAAVTNEDEETDLGAVDGADAGGEAEPEEVVVSIGDEPAATAEEEDPARAPEWLRELRKSNREKDRKLREQEAEIASLKGRAAPAAAVVLGEKPTLASCDFDEDKYESELESWHKRKQEVETQQRERAAAEQKSKDAWFSRLETYNKGKAALKVSDFEDAEETVKAAFSINQQGIIVAGAGNSTLLTYALGKNPKKLKELASIADPIQFAWACAQLQTQLKVTPRKAAPVPERTVKGGATGSAIDSALDKLMAEAEKTGDRTKVAQYHRNKKLAQRV